MNLIKILIIFSVICLIFLQTAEAYEIKQYYIEIQIVNSDVLVSQSIISDANQLRIEIPKDSRITDISETNYSFNEGLLTAASGNLKIRYLTREPLEKASKNYLTLNFKTYYSTLNLSARLILPAFSVLENGYPPGIIGSDGKHIILNWETSLKATESLPIFIVYRDKNQSNAWVYWLVLILVVGILTYFLKRKPKERIIRISKKKSNKEEIHLLESEKAVVNALKKAGGELWQKQIQLATLFSKAKLSRVIRNMEARNLIKRIPLGNTNKIKIK